MHRLSFFSRSETGPTPRSRCGLRSAAGCSIDGSSGPASRGRPNLFCRRLSVFPQGVCPLVLADSELPAGSGGVFGQLRRSRACWSPRFITSRAVRRTRLGHLCCGSSGSAPLFVALPSRLSLPCSSPCPECSRAPRVSLWPSSSRLPRRVLVSVRLSLYLCVPVPLCPRVFLCISVRASRSGFCCRPWWWWWWWWFFSGETPESSWRVTSMPARQRHCAACRK